MARHTLLRVWDGHAGDFARHGHSTGEGRMVRRGFLAETSNGLRPGPRAQGSGMRYHYSVLLLVTRKVW